MKAKQDWAVVAVGLFTDAFLMVLTYLTLVGFWDAPEWAAAGFALVSFQVWRAANWVRALVRSQGRVSRYSGLM